MLQRERCSRWCLREVFVFFFFNDTATTEIYTLSLHDALPIWYLFVVAEPERDFGSSVGEKAKAFSCSTATDGPGDRKSTRLNSSHVRTSRMPSSA